MLAQYVFFIKNKPPQHIVQPSDTVIYDDDRSVRNTWSAHMPDCAFSLEWRQHHISTYAIAVNHSNRICSTPMRKFTNVDVSFLHSFICIRITKLSHSDESGVPSRRCLLHHGCTLGTDAMGDVSVMEEVAQAVPRARGYTVWISSTQQKAAG